MVAKLGKWNEKHFAHKPTEGERPCAYGSETYRHAKAKQLLLARLRVKVPAVYASIPEGYTGKVPRLAEAQEVVAASAVAEQTIYVDEEGEIGFEDRRLYPDFDDHQGQRVLLARPDVIFFDDTGKRILLIEIYAEHRCTPEKIAKLRAYGIDTIEIHIPRHCDPAGIERLFTITSNTFWLYNGLQATFHFTPSGTDLLVDGSIPATELEERLSGRAETLKCRLNRVNAAVLAVRRVLGRADVAAENEAYRIAEATGQDYTRGFEQRRNERDTRLGEAIHARMQEHRAGLEERQRKSIEAEKAVRARQRELRERRSRLERRIQQKEAQLSRVVDYFKARLESVTGKVRSYNEDLESRIRAVKHTIRATQERHTTFERSQLDKQERELEQEEAELAAEEASLARSEETTGRGYRKRVSDLADTEQKTVVFESYYQDLQGIKSRTGH
ncbi:competence protein CoiA family protein [Hymenobacter metallilatus]|nr:hypothetical protein [Hymenobacter metallilatus]